MIIARSAFPIILVFIYNVTCSDDNSQYLQDVRRIQRGTYNFNHPPSFQYEPVPVAVVYDEESIPEGKTTKYNIKENTFSEAEDVELSSTVSVSSVSEHVTEGSKLQHARKDQKPKGRTFDAIQIPVAVVYDTETRHLRSNEEFSVKPKSRRQGQQKTITHKANLDKEKKNEDLKVITENDTHYKERTVVPKTFPKRTKGPDPVVPILQSETYVFSHSGNFHYSYEGGDGTKAYERGELKTFNDETKGETVVGNYSYTDKDGKDFSLSYTADENGYRPVGAHLPTPPPIPPAIARALKYLATKKPDIDSESVTKSYL